MSHAPTSIRPRMIAAASWKTLVVLALGTVDLLSAQEPKPGSDLPEFRAAFESGKDETTIAIAFVKGGEPLVLCAGNDAGGERVTPRTLVPLLGLARLLAADALHVQHKGKLDVGSGVKLGGRELSVLELLKGTPLLPDYAVLDGGPGEVSAAVLQECGEFAASGKVELRPTSIGAAEFVLLEPFAFGAQGRDWPSLLRTTLAPHVPGLDPVRADVMTAAQRPRLMLSEANLPVVTGAQPVLLRTLLSARDLATWWQWRALRDLPRWTGPRMGTSQTSPAVAAHQKWSVSSHSPAVSIHARLYPGHQAGFVWIGPAATAATRFDIIRREKAFEADLFAADGGRVDWGLVPPAADPVQVPAAREGPLAGTRWSLAADGKDQSGCRLTFGPTLGDPARLEMGGDERTVMRLMREGECLTGWVMRGTAMQGHVWIRPQPDAAAPTGLSVIVLIPRSSRTAALPVCVELTPEAR